MNSALTARPLGRGFAYAVLSASLLIVQIGGAQATDFSRLGAYNSQADRSGHGGATAKVALRLPFGHIAKVPASSVGFQFGIAQSMAANAPTRTLRFHDMRMIDIRFDGDGLAKARMGSVDLAPMLQPNRLNANGNMGNMGNGLFWILGGVVVGAGICWAAGCFDSDDDDTSTDTSTADS